MCYDMNQMMHVDDEMCRRKKEVEVKAYGGPWDRWRVSSHVCMGMDDTQITS
jgi:hypothetical protein